MTVAMCMDGINAILADPDTAIDQKLDAIVAVLRTIEPALFDHAAGLSDDELEQAFLDFVTRQEDGERLRVRRTLLALVGAAEMKLRADRAGVTVLEYARRMRGRRGG